MPYATRTHATLLAMIASQVPHTTKKNSLLLAKNGTSN